MHKRLSRPCVNDNSTRTSTKGTNGITSKGVSMDSYFSLPLSHADSFFLIDL